jgi:hypothetical protein
MTSVLSYWRKYRAAPQPQRELLTLALCLLLGLLLIPTGIWFVGSAVLGPYVDGGWASLLLDYYAGLARGSPAFWTVAVGPYAAVWCWRALRRAWRG